MPHFLPVLLVNLHFLDASPEFLSHPGSLTYPLLSSYWSFSYLLNQSEEALGRWARTDTSYSVIKYSATKLTVFDKFPIITMLKLDFFVVVVVF